MDATDNDRELVTGKWIAGFMFFSLYASIAIMWQAWTMSVSVMVLCILIWIQEKMPIPKWMIRNKNALGALFYFVIIGIAALALYV